MCSPRVLVLVVGSLLAPVLLAQQDAPPVDINQLGQALKALREQQALQVNSIKMKAIQDAQAASASGAAAINAWEEAVRMVQFEGATREGAQFREWKAKEGAAFNEKEVQNAARLYFVWLTLTLQRSAGVSTKELLPKIIQYTKEVTADKMAIEAMKERIKHETELVEKRPGMVVKEKRKEESPIVDAHNAILNMELGGSAPAKSLKVSEFVAMKNWESSPSDVDGIFEKIILPELRAAKDPRVLEYWDMKLKREGEAAVKTNLAFEAEKFSQVRRPELMWMRAQDQFVIGQRNKGLGDMFSVIKAYPAHPMAAGWTTKLEELLTAAPAGGAPTIPAGRVPGTR